MNARLAKEEIALLMPASLSNYADEPRILPESTRPTFVARIVSAIAWLADMPRRRSVLAELHELSDHELSDIGLSRSELNRVFDPEFAADRVRGRAVLGRALVV